MKIALAVVLALLVASSLLAQDAERDTAIYVEKYEDPVLKEIKEAAETLADEAARKTEEILAKALEDKEQRKSQRRQLRFDLGHIVRPEGPQAFTTRLWHFPPTPQYRTGTCWSFSTTSFLETEIQRQSGQEIKLSEMWTAYWEFVAKARGAISTRRESLFDHGSQSAAVLRVLREHGVVPRTAYEGVLAEDGRFDHDLMVDQINELLDWCKEHNFWDEEVVIAMVRLLLDRTMGRPPETVVWEDVELNPKQFLSDVCKLDLDAYVEFQSTLSEPFWKRTEFKVPDNWWHGADYINVPLETWYEVILRSLASGRSLVIGGDVSEPGLNGFEDIAVIPSFDIPGELIDQSARELRIYNETTTDDHGVHCVGHLKLDGHDWFLIKDSNRSSRHGRFEGYYMYRDDYVRLKMLTLMVHKDVVPDLLAQVVE